MVWPFHCNQALRLNRPLFVAGEAGMGKTALAAAVPRLDSLWTPTGCGCYFLAHISG